MHKPFAKAILRNGWLILATIILLSIFITVNWYYYNTTRRNLERSLGDRLRAAAAGISSQIEPHLFTSDTTGYFAELDEHLEKFKQNYNLSNILIIREDGTIIHSLQSSLYHPDENYPYWIMDYSAIIKALEHSMPSTTSLRSSNGSYLKAGYAPLSTGSSGISAVVCVEAGTEFFENLKELKWILVITNVVSIISVAIFIWFILKATGSLIQTREALMRAETLSSMGRMASGIAHEIRNPLFIIRSSAEKLKNAHQDQSEEIDEFIIEEVDRLNDILTNYLLFSKDEPIKMTRTDLVKILNRSIRLMSETINDESITTTSHITLDEAPIVGEDTKLKQSFLNLMLNAVESLDGGGKIHVGLYSDDTDYTIVLRDNGRGVAKKDLDRIFEPFYTTKPSGSGLGLPIVKNVMEKHGGTINIRSSESQGTTVIVKLPIDKEKWEKKDE